MNQERERRRYSRYEASLEIVIRELSPPGTPDPLAVSIHSETRNISTHGLCVQLDQACPDSALVRCEIHVPSCPVAIPTLAQVRWVQDGQGTFVAGLEFLPQ